jgi:CheY-like chemotaxis protein
MLRSIAASPSPLVLVVDDDEDTRDTYAFCLESAGFRVQCAHDGAEAIAKARDLIPDVLIMDLSLPLVDGCEATRVLKADPATRGIQIVALSGYSGKSQVDEAKAAGVDAYAVKPISIDQLTELVAERSGMPLHRA